MGGRTDGQGEDALRAALRDALAGLGEGPARTRRARLKERWRQRRRRLSPWTTAFRGLRGPPAP